MTIIHNNQSYTVAFFFGRTGEPKKTLDETTPCVQTTDGKSFLCAECTFPDETPTKEQPRKTTIGFHPDTDEGFG